MAQYGVITRIPKPGGIVWKFFAPGSQPEDSNLVHLPTCVRCQGFIGEGGEGGSAARASVLVIQAQ